MGTAIFAFCTGLCAAAVPVFAEDLSTSQPQIEVAQANTNVANTNVADATKRLFEATKKNDLPAVEASIRSGADILATDETGQTPLDVALGKGYFDIARYLTGVYTERRAKQTEQIIGKSEPAAPPLPEKKPEPSAKALAKTETAAGSDAGRPNIPLPRRKATPPRAESAAEAAPEPAPEIAEAQAPAKPPAPPVLSESAARVSPGPAEKEIPNTYVIKQGDTLFKIARRFDIDPADLASLNRLEKADRIEVGTRLLLPPSAKTRSIGTPAAAPAETPAQEMPIVARGAPPRAPAVKSPPAREVPAAAAPPAEPARANVAAKAAPAPAEKPARPAAAPAKRDVKSGDTVVAELPKSGDRLAVQPEPAGGEQSFLVATAPPDVALLPPPNGPARAPSTPEAGGPGQPAVAAIPPQNGSTLPPPLPVEDSGASFADEIEPSAGGPNTSAPPGRSMPAAEPTSDAAAPAASASTAPAPSVTAPATPAPATPTQANPASTVSAVPPATAPSAPPPPPAVDAVPGLADDAAANAANPPAAAAASDTPPAGDAAPAANAATAAAPDKAPQKSGIISAISRGFEKVFGPETPVEQEKDDGKPNAEGPDQGAPVTAETPAAKDAPPENVAAAPAAKDAAPEKAAAAPAPPEKVAAAPAPPAKPAKPAVPPATDVLGEFAESGDAGTMRAVVPDEATGSAAADETGAPPEQPAPPKLAVEKVTVADLPSPINRVDRPTEVETSDIPPVAPARVAPALTPDALNPFDPANAAAGSTLPIVDPIAGEHPELGSVPIPKNLPQVSLIPRSEIPDSEEDKRPHRGLLELPKRRPRTSLIGPFDRINTPNPENGTDAPGDAQITPQSAPAAPPPPNENQSRLPQTAPPPATPAKPEARAIVPVPPAKTHPPAAAPKEVAKAEDAGPPPLVNIREPLRGVGLSLGTTLRPGLPPDTGGPSKPEACINKSKNSAVFCIVPVEWPREIAPDFAVNTALYRGTRAIVRYDHNKATHLHSLFKSSSFDAVVSYFTALYGEATDSWKRTIVPQSRPRQPNPTWIWRSVDPKTNRTTVLEVRHFDDTRAAFPDTAHGVVRLYIAAANPDLPTLSGRNGKSVDLAARPNRTR